MIYEIVEKAKLNRNTYYSLVYATDIFVTFVAAMMSIYFIVILTFDTYTPSHIGIWEGLTVFWSVLSFWWFKTSTNTVRHSTLHALGILVAAVLVKEMLTGLCIYALQWYVALNFPHLCALLALDFINCCLLLIIERIGVVLGFDVMKQLEQRRRKSPDVLVYGTTESSVSFVQLQAISPNYHVIGFLIPGRIKHGIRIADKVTLGFNNETDFKQLADHYQFEAVIFTRRQDITDEDKRLIRYCHKNNVQVLFAPPIEEVVEHRGRSKGKARQISIEDILERPEIEINMTAIREQFEDRTIMVTGAAGSIGSELCRQLAMMNIRRLILFDNAETPLHNIRLELSDRFPELNFVPIIGDVRSVSKLDAAFSAYEPEVVFHAAAYKHVPLMEENPAEAVEANVIGSRNVADMCIKYGVEKMVMISTDKAVNPTNIMGCTKRLAEIYVQSLAQAIANGTIKGKTQFVTTRFGNVLGSNGSVIPRFREQIERGGPVTVTHPDITRFFMTIPEACRLVMEAATMGEVNKIFVFDMGRSVKIAHLAERMIELAGYEVGKDIKIEYTGLRPGEKLYEEVLATEENTIPTKHSKIHVAKVREYAYDAACNRLDKLADLCLRQDIPAMVRLMKHIVPEFKSKNSEFEMFDAEIEEEIIQMQR